MTTPTLNLDSTPAPAISSQEEFFGKEEIDTTWTDHWMLTCQPAAVIDDSRITFQFQKLSGRNFAFLNRMSLKMQVSLCDKDGNVPAVDQTVAPINLFTHTMFSSVRVYLNEQQVSGSTNGLYPYYSYISTLLSNTTDKKCGMGTLSCYYEDDKKSWKELVEEKSGWSDRRDIFGELTKTGTFPAEVSTFTYQDNTHTFYADLFTEFTGTQTPLISQIGGRVELMLNKPEFYLQCEETNVADCKSKAYRLKIHQAELAIPIRTMTPSLNAALEKKLLTTALQYQTTRVEMKKILIPMGNSIFTTDSIKQTTISPDRLYLFLLPEEQLTSAYGLSPLRLTNFIEKDDKKSVLNSIRLSLNNQSLESSDSSTTARDLVMRKLYELYQNLGCQETDFAPRINPNEYAQGKFVMLYDLTKAKRASLMDSRIRPEVKTGNLKVELSFSEPIPANTFLMVMSEYHSKVTVDLNRNISYHYLA